jgi:hypothetical protein
MYKGIHFFFLFLILNLSNSIAQTIVSGFISTNTVWDTAGSPYIVVGNVYVISGNILRIDPGVIVKFETDKAIQIDGTLIAIGTPSSRIVFTSNQPVPAPGDWGKIQFSDTCVSAVIDESGNYVSGSIMKYCDVKYGGALGFGMIHIIRTSPYFNHCNIKYSEADGIFSIGASYLIDSSTISNCLGTGLNMERYFEFQCSVLIQDDTIAYNLGGGINMDASTFQNCNWDHLTQIRRNVFLSNSPYGLRGPGSEWNNLIISGNIFDSNYGTGNTVSAGATNYSIWCNKFINNTNKSGVLFIAADYYAMSSPAYFIQDNLFQGNSVSNGWIINSKIVAYHRDLIFENNVIVNNSTVTDAILKIEGDLSSVNEIHHNDLLNNTGPNAIKFIPFFGQTGSNHQFVNMTNNNVVNPNCSYEIYNAVPYGNPNIHIENNYWGSISSQHIDSVIYDYFDLANQSVCFYLPILTTSAPVDTSCTSTQSTEITPECNSTIVILFPNPTTSHFTIRFPCIIENGKVDIYDILGQIVYQDLIVQTDEKVINLPNVASGIYLVTINDGKKYFSQKLIVEKN